MPTQAALEEWTANLISVDLPVLKYTLTEIDLLRSNIDNTSYRDLANLIRKDALLTLRVLRYQQNNRGNRQVTDVNTLDRVLLMIGTQGFVREFGRAQTLQETLAGQPDAIAGSCRALARSAFAARLAQNFCERRSDIDPNEVVMAALLDNLAEILLWVAAPYQASRIEASLRAQPGFRSQQAQQAELGCTLAALQLEIANEWHLPPLLRHLMDEHFAHEPRVKTVHLATALARHLGHGWLDPALPDDYAGVSQLLGLSNEEAYSLVRNTAIATAHDWHWYNVTPALAGRPQTAA